MEIGVVIFNHFGLASQTIGWLVIPTPGCHHMGHGLTGDRQRTCLHLTFVVLSTKLRTALLVHSRCVIALIIWICVVSTFKLIAGLARPLLLNWRRPCPTLTPSASYSAVIVLSGRDAMGCGI